MRPSARGRVVTLGALLLASLPLSAWGGGRSAEPRDAVIKVYATRLLPQNGAPWRPGSPSAVSGSGFVVEGQRILTNTHVVRDATFVQVRRYGDAEKTTARVLHVSHEAGLGGSCSGPERPLPHRAPGGGERASSSTGGRAPASGGAARYWRRRSSLTRPASERVRTASARTASTC